MQARLPRFWRVVERQRPATLRPLDRRLIVNLTVAASESVYLKTLLRLTVLASAAREATLKRRGERVSFEMTGAIVSGGGGGAGGGASRPWHIREPESVNVLPASGTNCQS